jgi:flagellar biosynthesis component FlhA
MAELLSYGEVQKLIKELPKEQSELVKDIMPQQITVSGVQRVLQLLLAERISIRDLSSILEGVADAISFTRNPVTIAEHVRVRLARQICGQHTTRGGYLPLIALSAKWEQNFAESIIGTGEERSLAMQPSRLSEFITLVRERFEDAARARRRCWLPRRRSGRSCAASSSASAARPACCRSRKSTRGCGSKRSARYRAWDGLTHRYGLSVSGRVASWSRFG